VEQHLRRAVALSQVRPSPASPRSAPLPLAGKGFARLGSSAPIVCLPFPHHPPCPRRRKRVDTQHIFLYMRLVPAREGARCAAQHRAGRERWPRPAGVLPAQAAGHGGGRLTECSPAASAVGPESRPGRPPHHRARERAVSLSPRHAPPPLSASSPVGAGRRPSPAPPLASEQDGEVRGAGGANPLPLRVRCEGGLCTGFPTPSVAYQRGQHGFSRLGSI
jgi:hypothetical protein